ncbi:MAG: P-type conjugative transfer protein TrbG, partial [Burkholderiales bacterium]
RIQTKVSSTASVGGNLAAMIFDFAYSGDVSGIPQALKAYDSSAVALKSLGHPKAIVVNLDLSQVKIQDIADAISSQTNNKVNLLFNAPENTLRLNFSGGMDVGKDAIEESLKWQKGANPKPVLNQDGIVRFPYGEYQPVVTCQPLNLCDIELQAGEEIQGILIGDSQRWNEGDQGIPVVYSGAADKLAPHLVLKPSQGGLDTSLMITTSKRTYMIKLKSAFNGYLARAGFYYPQEMIQKFEYQKAAIRQIGTNSTTEVSRVMPEVTMPLIDLAKVNYGYTISGDEYAWKPTQVFDDGTSVYIQMPEGVGARDLPGLCVIVEGDATETKCEMVNFRYNDHFYIVDKLFSTARLINGFDDYAQTITITRKAKKKSLWARLFGD